MDSTTVTEVHLPADVKPIHYDLTICTNLDRQIYAGIAVIHLDVLHGTKTITFNSVDLQLHQISAALEGSTSCSPASRDVNEVDGQVTLGFLEEFPPGSKVQLRLIFSASLSQDKGYYKSKEAEVDGQAVYAAVTQFHPSATRRAFPCWDEPTLKATFALSMISVEESQSLFTMPSISIEECSVPANLGAAMYHTHPIDTNETRKWMLTRFEPTPKMSTYMLAWANGKFDILQSSYTSPLSGISKKILTHANKGKAELLRHAIELTAKLLIIYEDIFKIEFPLPQLDILAVSEVDSGVLETQWGLVIVSLDDYAADDPSPSEMASLSLAKKICRQLNQQWFGGLATWKWWDALYLNVGLASYIGEVLVPGKLFPQADVDGPFVRAYVQGALGLDDKKSARPLEVSTKDADTADQTFDALKWTKSGAVIRMLAHYIGEDAFIRGASAFLKEHAFGHASSQDLWKAMSQEAGHDVDGIMTTWVIKAGFPYITVSETSKGIIVRQKCCLDTDTVWYVPLQIRILNEYHAPVTVADVVLSTNETQIQLDLTKPYKLNAGIASLVRVAYPPECLSGIAEEAVKNEAVFNAMDRINLITDAAALAKAGFMRTSSALDLAYKFRNDGQPQVWEAISGFTTLIRDVWFEHKPIVESITTFRRLLFAPLVERLGFDPIEGEDSGQAQLRQAAITGAVAGQDPKVTKELHRRFQHFVHSGDSKQIDGFRNAAFTAAIRYGGKEEFDTIKTLYDKAVSQSDKVATIMALCGSTHVGWVKDVLHAALGDAPLEDLELFVFGSSHHISSRRMIATFFMDNYLAFTKRFGSSLTFQHVVRDAFVRLSSRNDAEEVETFFKDKNISGFASVFAQTLDTIRAASEWKERSTEDVEHWLQDRHH